MVISGSIALVAYTGLFIVIANGTLCLMADPGPLLYLPQRAVAIASIAIGVWFVVRASRFLQAQSSRSLIAAHCIFGGVLFFGAAVRFAYVGFFTGWAVCGYLP